MEQSNVQLEDSIAKLSPLRECDQSIMDIAIEEGYKGDDLKLINEARMFMKIHFVSEMCIGDEKNYYPKLTMVNLSKQTTHITG